MASGFEGVHPPPSEPRDFIFIQVWGNQSFGWLESCQIHSWKGIPKSLEFFFSCDPGDEPSTMLAICKMDGTSQKDVDDPENWHCDAEFRNNLLLRSVVFPYFSLVHCYSIDSCRELNWFPEIQQFNLCFSSFWFGERQCKAWQ